MDRRVTESDRLELENKLLHRTAEPISLRLGFLESITSNFSKEQEIGSGGYGVVYKGILLCGSVIAVKKFGRIPVVDDQSFENEASFLMDIKHHNVVQLLGFCDESRGAKMMKQPNGKCIVVHEQTRMLCFEYMCNGGLDKHLSDESSGLEWNTRYKIIKGICSGLKYLHGCNIIHMDLKPQNILLDATMTPKIADFGLSRLLGEQKSYTVNSNCPGTRGYMAPEYTDRGVISKKADIFSLGVIIIEILNGCKDDYPDYRLSTEINFQHFKEKVLRNWRNRFEGSSKHTSPEQYTQLVKQCIDIALKCVHPDKAERPDVSNIIDILNAAEESCYDQNGEGLPVDHQMDITPLSDLRKGILDYKICVRVSRMWEFKGKDEQQDTKHLDLVLVDQKGDSIYAEIPRDVIPYVKPHLEEGKIIVMSKITVERAKPSYRVVQNPYMIKLNRRTCIKEAINQEPDFPKYAFSLISFDKLPNTKSTDYFIDVIGKIIGVSNAGVVRTTNGDFPTRVVQLQDLKGNIIELSPSGARALEFDGDAVLEVGQNHHVIAIFVGTLMKKYRFLGGSSACRWYINENDIPEIKSFERSLTGPVIPIQRLPLQGGYDGKQDFEKRTLMQLQTIDPFTEKANIYECTVTISGIMEGQTWCYQACRDCSSRMPLEPNTYKCTKEGCSSTQFDWKYKIPFLGTDETYTLEFVFFEKRGTQLIGKTAENLYKQYKPTEIPPEISTWIGHKFTFAVRILSIKSIKAVDPSFVVESIKERFGRQSIIQETGAFQNISDRSTIKEQDRPLLVPIMSKRKPVQLQSPRIPPDGNIEDNMDIETSEDWNEKDASNKRVFKKIKYDSQEGTNDEHEEREQENKVKKQH